MDADQWAAAATAKIETKKLAAEAAAVLHCSIAALEGPEFLSRERRMQIGEQLRATVEFIEQVGARLE
jgi:hypothetical protein